MLNVQKQRKQGIKERGQLVSCHGTKIGEGGPLNHKFTKLQVGSWNVALLGALVGASKWDSCLAYIVNRKEKNTCLLLASSFWLAYQRLKFFWKHMFFAFLHSSSLEHYYALIEFKKQEKKRVQYFFSINHLTQKAKPRNLRNCIWQVMGIWIIWLCMRFPTLWQKVQKIQPLSLCKQAQNKWNLTTSCDHWLTLSCGYILHNPIFLVFQNKSSFTHHTII